MPDTDEFYGKMFNAFESEGEDFDKNNDDDSKDRAEIDVNWKPSTAEATNPNAQPMDANFNSAQINTPNFGKDMIEDGNFVGGNLPEDRNFTQENDSVDGKDLSDNFQEDTTMTDNFQEDNVNAPTNNAEDNKEMDINKISREFNTKQFSLGEEYDFNTDDYQCTEVGCGFKTSSPEEMQDHGMAHPNGAGEVKHGHTSTYSELQTLTKEAYKENDQPDVNKEFASKKSNGKVDVQGLNNIENKGKNLAKENLIDYSNQPSHGVSFKCNCGEMISETQYTSHMAQKHGDTYNTLGEVKLPTTNIVATPDDDVEVGQNADYNHDLNDHRVIAKKGELSTVRESDTPANEAEIDLTRDEVFDYLFELQDSGETNMMGAGPYLEREFGMDSREAGDYAVHWMTNWEDLAQARGIEALVRPRATEVEQEEVSQFLDELRESGQTNMFGAGSYVEDEFGIDKREAKKFVLHWMKNFGKEALTTERLTPEQERAFRLSQKSGAKFDPLWNMTGKLGDDPEFDDANQEYEQFRKGQPEQDYQAIQDLELYGMVDNEPTGDYMDYSAGTSQESPDPTYRSKPTSAGLGWQERTKGNDYDYYKGESKATEDIFGSDDNQSDFETDDTYPSDPDARYDDGDGNTGNNYLTDSHYNMSYDDMYRQMVDKGKEFVQYELDRAYSTPDYDGLMQSYRNWHGGGVELPGSVLQTDQAQQALQSARDEIVDWIRNLKQEAEGTLASPSWENKATEVKEYCNMCGFETNRRNAGDSCPYHQRVLDDGTFLYDEFNQDGESLANEMVDEDIYAQDLLDSEKQVLKDTVYADSLTKQETISDDKDLPLSTAKESGFDGPYGVGELLDHLYSNGGSDLVQEWDEQTLQEADIGGMVTINDNTVQLTNAGKNFVENEINIPVGPDQLSGDDKYSTNFDSMYTGISAGGEPANQFGTYEAELPQMGDGQDPQMGQEPQVGASGMEPQTPQIGMAQPEPQINAGDYVGEPIGNASINKCMGCGGLGEVIGSAGPEKCPACGGSGHFLVGEATSQEMDMPLDDPNQEVEMEHQDQFSTVGPKKELDQLATIEASINANNPTQSPATETYSRPYAQEGVENDNLNQNNVLDINQATGSAEMFAMANAEFAALKR